MLTMNTVKRLFAVITLMVILLTSSVSVLAEQPAFQHTLPVIMLTVDEDALWNETDGMLTEGPNVDKNQLPFKNTVYRETMDLLRDGHIKMIMPDGTVMLDQDMKITVTGYFDLDYPQKSFKLHALENEAFTGKLFDNRERDAFGSLLLSNSEQDNLDTHVRGMFFSNLLDQYGSTVLHQAFRPVAVYLNGTYWGMYALGEMVDTEWIAWYTQTDANGICVASGSGSVDETASGSDWKTIQKDQPTYKEIIRHIADNPPCDSEENLLYLETHIDVDSYLDWLAYETFVGNSNIGIERFYRAPGGKWKWMSWSNAYSLFNSEYDSVKFYAKDSGFGATKVDNTIFRSLMQIPKYKNLFMEKVGRIFQFCTIDRMNGILDPLVMSVSEEMMLHCVRWAHEDNQSVDMMVPNEPYAYYEYWQRRILRMHNSIGKRRGLLWDMVQSYYQLTDDEMTQWFGEAPATWQDLFQSGQ